MALRLHAIFSCTLYTCDPGWLGSSSLGYVCMLALFSLTCCAELLPLSGPCWPAVDVQLAHVDIAVAQERTRYQAALHAAHSAVCRHEWHVRLLLTATMCAGCCAGCYE
jgi:hypothetical protein